MTPARRRRTRPSKMSSSSLPRRKTSPRTKGSRRDRIIKFFIVLFLLADLILVFFIIRQCSEPPTLVEEETGMEQSEPIQIEVLNGCGVQGIANDFTDFLRNRGFDVVKTENYESFNVQRTVIIDRRGNQQNCKSLAEAMGLGEDRILQEVNEAYLIDATVILGRDYRQLSSWQNMER